MADFIQPYPNSQTVAKNIILQRKGSQGVNTSLEQIDAHKRNELLTLFPQEIYGGGSAENNSSDEVQGIISQIKSEQEVQGILNQIKSEQTQKTLDDIKQDVQRIYGANNP